MSQPLLPSGLHDLLPPDAGREQTIITHLLGRFASFGYEQVTPPLLEFEDTLLSGKGQAYAPLTFRVADPDSRRMMGLRADITTQVARVAATHRDRLPSPARLSYAGRVLRSKPQGLLPDRQLVQGGIEIVGESGPEAVREVLTVCLESISSLGAGDLVVDLTMAGLVDALLGDDLSAAGRAEAHAAVKRKSAAALPDEIATRTLLVTLLGLNGEAKNVLSRMQALDLPTVARKWTSDAAAVIKALGEDFPNVEINLDPLESHGFEYQEGLCFSLFDRGPGREVGRGGCYVIHAENDLPACGATLYVRRLMEGGYGAAPARRRVFLPWGTPESEARKLRESGAITLRALIPDATDLTATESIFS